MRIFAALLLLLLTGPGFGQVGKSAVKPLGTKAVVAPATLDLSGQFPTAADRDQGNTGSCHVFSSSSLLEAALFRRWGLRHVLSEAELFVRRIIMQPGYYAQAQKVLTAEPGTKAVYKLVEGGSVLEDARFAITHGVVKEAHAPWKDFEARYAAFEQQQLASIGKQAVVVTMTGEALKDIKDDRSRVVPGSDNIENVRQAYLQRVETKITVSNMEARKGFAAFLSQIEGKTEAEAEGLLLSTSPALAQDRRAYKSLMTGFTAAPWDFTVDAAKTTDELCRTQGLDRKKALLAAFLRSIPVSVTMDLDGLSEWGKFSGRTMHAFTVTGYTTDADGRILLKSRNSWGGNNPDIPEKRFCKISRIVVVRTDQEK